MAEDDGPLLVRAKFKFSGKNNDELCFNKNDIITITQKLDGGWWEGTLNGKTGWFPSNYAIPTSNGERHLRAKSPAGLRNIEFSLPTQSNKTVYRTIVVKDLIEAERCHVNELQTLFRDFLMPLQSADILSNSEYDHLVGNLEQIIQLQLSLLTSLEENTKKPSNDQKVGGRFMSMAPTIKTLMKIYCENHPRAVEVLSKRRNELKSFMETKDGSIKTLISGLSKPFRHLDKYPSTLQELERNMEESHPDRGDTQRAVHVYRELTNVCAEIRKQKEMQYELLNSGLISGWDNDQTITSLGDIRHMGSVAIKTNFNADDKDDRCLVLFPEDLLVLGITEKLNSYILIRRLPLPGLSVHRVDGGQFVLELRGAGDPLSLDLKNADELNKWLEVLQGCDGLSLDDSCNTISPTEPSKYDTVQGNLSPLIKPQVSMMPSPGQAQFKKSSTLPPTKLDFDLEMIEPESDLVKPQHLLLSNRKSFGTKLWSGFCLRPHAAPQGNFAVDPEKAAFKLRRQEPVNDQDDAQVLKVVEAYCTSAVTNKHLGSGAVASPQLLVPEDEKILVEVMEGDEVIVEEKSLVDTVYSLKEQLNSVQEEVKSLSKGLEREQRARKRIEELYRRSIHNNASTLDSLPPKHNLTPNGYVDDS